MHLVFISTYNWYPLMEEGKLDQQVATTKSPCFSLVPMHMDQNGCSSYHHHKVRKNNIQSCCSNASQSWHTQVKPKNGVKTNDIVIIYSHQSIRHFIHVLMQNTQKENISVICISPLNYLLNFLISYFHLQITPDKQLLSIIGL